MSNGLRLTGKALDAFLKSASPKQIASLKAQGVVLPGNEPEAREATRKRTRKRRKRARKSKEECKEYDYVSGPISDTNPLEGHPLRRKELTVTVHEPEPLALPWGDWTCAGIDAITMVLVAVATVGEAVIHAAYRAVIIVFGYGVFRK